MPKPTVARIVHYHPLNTAGPCAAIVVGVEPLVLCVFFVDGSIAQTNPLAESIDGEPGTWSWPPVVR